MSRPATTSSSAELFSPVTNSALTDLPSAVAPSARSASVSSSACTLHSMELSSPVANNVPTATSTAVLSSATTSRYMSVRNWLRRNIPTTLSGAAEVLAQTGEATSIRRPGVALADLPPNILYDVTLNLIVTSFLTPSDVSALSRVSRALYFHVDFKRNPFWLFCLLPEYRLQNSAPGHEPRDFVVRSQATLSRYRPLPGLRQR